MINFDDVIKENMKEHNPSFGNKFLIIHTEY